MNQTIYPIGIQNFEKIRKDGYLYIDKTALIYQLVKTGSYYFLSRPRRFGKSLLLSTLEAYFQGKKELFEGLAMEKLEKDWKEYPILHFDLNISQYDSPDSLYKILNDILSRYEDEYGTRPSEVTLPLRFAGIIDRAYRKTGQRAVILIDEYDKPLLQNLHDEEMQNRLRNMLKPFYGVLKTMDRAIRFALLTGVTKFGKISVFSDLNNLMDLSMDNRYVEICGITEKEIHAYLEDEVKELADTQMTTYEETCLKLKQRYDGYHFTAKSEGIYNPFSLLNTFAKMEFGDYWFETGTPSYLVELLKHTITTSTRWPTRRPTPTCSTASTPPRTIPYPSSTKAGILPSRAMILSLAFIDWVSRTRRWKKVSSNTYFLSIRAYKPLRPPSRSDSSFGRYGLAITTPSSTASKASSPTHPTR